MVRFRSKATDQACTGKESLEDHSQVQHLTSPLYGGGLELDCKSNIDCWAKVIAKENKQVKVS